MIHDCKIIFGRAGGSKLITARRLGNGYKVTFVIEIYLLIEDVLNIIYELCKNKVRKKKKFDI